MAKLTHSTPQEVYHIKAMIPFGDEMTGDISEESPYRIIAVPSDISLGQLGDLVLNAFQFDNDHLFGFYDNWRRYSSSKICYEHPEFMDDQMDGFGGETTKQVFSMEDYDVAEVFTRKGKKWLMLFDYGDEWPFWLSLNKRVPVEAAKQAPYIVESKYEAPEQYPDYDDEDEF